MQIQTYDCLFLKVDAESTFVTFGPCTDIFNIMSFAVLIDFKFFSSSKEYTWSTRWYL